LELEIPPLQAKKDGILNFLRLSRLFRS
jgi:hypothetical protein